jgi:preprotein translocase subunit SecY
MSLARKVIQIVKIRELRNSIMFVLGVLVIFRFAAHIPIPGINSENLASFFAGNEIFGLINIFSGGALESFSIVALGIAPYITSSIIFQLLQLVVPRLEELSKEGEQGRQKINQYTRMATVPLAALQGYGIIRILQGHSSQIISPTISIYELVTMIIILTTGTIFLMWLGELISERKIGNGISILIFAGIVSAIPTSIQTFIINYDPSQIQNIILFSGIALITIAAIVFITEGQRNVPVTYARRMRGTHMLGGTTIIFAFSLILFPPLIAQFLTRADSDLLARSGGFILRIFDPSHPFYITFFFLLVVGFTYFYTFVTFKPENIAENLQKQGAFIPGIRPGKNTEEYLNKIVSRIVLAGALFLGVVALLPFIIQAATGIGSVAISGASLLIVVGVVIEIQKQINAQLTMREYEGI